MKSHTIPERLLRQFAYYDSITKSPRLWKYSKGIPPYSRASPKTAARIDGYFASPTDEKTEALVETRLAQEIENPVHKFISKFDDPLWRITIPQRLQMTRYINLLFNRCVARKEGSKHSNEMMQLTVERFIRNETRLLTVAAQWSMKSYFRGQALLFTPKHIAEAATRVLTRMQAEPGMQEGYVDFISSMLTKSLTPKSDEALVRGEWRVFGQLATKHLFFLTRRL